LNGTPSSASSQTVPLTANTPANISKTVNMMVPNANTQIGLQVTPTAAGTLTIPAGGTTITATRVAGM
jgi:hypothetical protein